MRQGTILIVLLACLAAAAPAGAADPLRSKQWGLTMVNADAARATSTGAGATVAVIDSGAALGHPDLQGRLIAGPDFVDGDNVPSDGEGHGTHVAGIVAANAGNNVGVESVAPGAKVLVIRVLDNKGSGSQDHVVAGIDWATNHGADVINLSLGPDVPLVGTSPDFDAAINRALDRGIVVVAAAGNGVAVPGSGLGVPGSGLPVCDQPSGQGRLLCVGAVDPQENRSHYSNFGMGLGIMAPGGAATFFAEDDILSTVPSSRNAFGPYDYMAGTSQASPHVAGVAALLVSLGVRGQAATQRILATARDVGAPGPDPVYGAGIVDARAAVAGLRRTGGAGGGGAGTGSGSGSGSGSGAGSPGSGANAGAAARVSLARVQKLRSVLRGGLRVVCTAAGSGRCRVAVTASRRRIATGSRAVTVGRRTTVVARLTTYGRALLSSALRRRRTVVATVYVALPGARTQKRTVFLRP
jgi:subtilisin family serine protease